MPRRQAQTGSLGKRARLWKPHCLHDNRSVDTAITISSQQIHTIRKWHVLLYAGWIIKYPQSVANSLLLPPESGALHLFSPWILVEKRGSVHHTPCKFY